jgi:hypothetical protein
VSLRCATLGCGAWGIWVLEAPAPIRGRWCSDHRPAAWFALAPKQEKAPDREAPGPVVRKECQTMAAPRATQPTLWDSF